LGVHMIKGLEQVLKPGRYTGGEVNQVIKEDSEVSVRFALAFPDAYEIGMSHSGQKILYHILNSIKGVWAQRVFAPWPDMASLLEQKRVPLFSLEEKRPLGMFDMAGFSLMHELSYTTVLRMLSLSGIPLYAAERKKDDPIIIAGGSCASSPAPFLPFFDLVVIGDGEEVVAEMAQICLGSKDRDERIEAMSGLAGVYRPGSGGRPVRRILTDLDKYAFPSDLLVPNISIVHDRLGVEVARGCTRGCRFCQAGMIYRPYRERSFKSVIDTFRRGLKTTGYDSLAMTALSITDLSYLADIMESLNCPSREVSLGVPSMRVEGMTERMADIISSVRKPGFTLAVEAATERLRAVINKGNTEDELLRSISIIKKQGWKLIKLYFMIGLPTETEADIQAIARLSKKIANAFRGGVNVSVSTYIPKTFTPFQWESQIGSVMLNETLRYLKRELRDRRISLKWTEPVFSGLEGVFSRGDERLSGVIENAFRQGAYLDGWSDTFNNEAWVKAFEKTGIDPRSYLRERQVNETQPWEFIDMGIDRGFLLKERQLAYEAVQSPDCREGECLACGVCSGEVKNIVSGPAEKIELFQTQAQGRYPYVIGFSRTGALSLIGNRDFIEMLKRAVRRAGLRASYSEGFSPAMRLTLIPPVSLGIASEDEYMQLDLADDLTTEEVAKSISGHMPEGSFIKSCEKGRLRQVSSYTFRLRRPSRLNPEESASIKKGEADLAVKDYLGQYDENSLTIRFVGGRTISPVLLVDAFGSEKLLPSDIIKTGTSFIEVNRE
jgi:radical SAM-linked protein